MKFRIKNNGEYEFRVTRREKRIAAKRRMKAKAKRIGRREKEADHLAICSCEMCCNQRRNDWLNSEEKLTMQERRMSDAETA